MSNQLGAEKQLELLRLSVGLTHSVPGATLKLRNGSGPALLAGPTDDAAMTLCELRRLVMAAVCPSGSRLIRQLQAIEVGGSLARTRNGLFVDTDGGMQWWFPTLLRQERVLSQIEDLETDHIEDDAVELYLKPDHHLGMTSVGFIASDPTLRPTVLRLALSAYWACRVEELICASRVTRSSTPAESKSMRNQEPEERDR